MVSVSSSLLLLNPPVRSLMFEQCRSQLMKETMYANKSQTFLGQMMMGQRGQASVRQCKLTHYLRNCIGGNCNTVVIANLWGEQEHLQETVRLLFLLHSSSTPLGSPNWQTFADVTIPLLTLLLLLFSTLKVCHYQS